MKIAFATVVSNGYAMVFEHLLKSILRYNPKFNYDFYVFYTMTSYRTLAPRNIEYFKKLYPNIIPKSVDCEKYDKQHKTQPKFYSFESFRLNQYDKVIYLDSDLLCRMSLDEFIKDLEKVTRIGMVKEIHRSCSNAGLIIIDKSFLTDEIYNDLLNFEYRLYKDEFGNDQAVYNVYFRNKIFEINRKYNTFADEGVGGSTVFSHYIHKPNSIRGRGRLTANLLEEWDYYNTDKKEIIT